MLTGSGEHTLDLLSLFEIQSLERNPTSVFSILAVDFSLDDFQYIDSTPMVGKDYSSYPFPAYFNDDDSNTYSLIFGDDFSPKDSLDGTFTGGSSSSSQGDNKTPGFGFILVIMGISVMLFLIKRK